MAARRSHVMPPVGLDDLDETLVMKSPLYSNFSTPLPMSYA